MSARFFDLAGREHFNRLSDREKRTQTIVPDLVTSHHPPGSALAVSGPQMWELKRVHSITSFSRTGEQTGLNDYFRPRRVGRLVRGADRRAAKVPSEYTAKATKADATFGAQGTSAVRDALRALTQVRGIVLGAPGEFSEPTNPDKFGQSNYQAAYGAIHWWLKRRWVRLAVITAVESRYAALGYTGGAAQQQAAAAHAQAQAQDDWRADGAYRQREVEIAALFLGSSGGAKPSFLSCCASLY